MENRKNMEIKDKVPARFDGARTDRKFQHAKL